MLMRREFVFVLLAACAHSLPTNTTFNTTTFHQHLDPLDVLDSQILISQDGSQESGSEEPEPVQPKPRNNHALVASGLDALYVFGGWDEERMLLEDLWKYDLNDNRWTESTSGSGGPTPSARCWHTMVINPDDSKLFLFGGYDGKNDLNDLWRFSLAQGQWTKLKPKGMVPLPRDRHAMVYHNRGLVVFGGYIGTYVNDLWHYSLLDNEWAAVTVLGTGPARRRGHAITSVEKTDKLFVFGGFTGEKFLSDLWEFDYARHIWTEIRGSMRPLRRAGHALVADNAGSLLLFGGFDGSKYRVDLWKHNDGEGWRKTQPEFDQPSERTDMGMVYQASRRSRDKGRLFMFGGFDGNEKLNDVHKYELSSNQWRPLLCAPDQ